MIASLVAVLCVFGLAIGQLLFKASAMALQENGSFFSFKTLAMLAAAVCLYGVTSVAWVWVLQRVELGKMYPMMALAFILVPIGSYFAFGERFNAQYLLGAALIFCGIIVATRS